jgi:hypothetical protein
MGPPLLSSGAVRFIVKTGPARHPLGWRAELIRSAKCVRIPGAKQDGPVQSETRAVLLAGPLSGPQSCLNHTINAQWFSD